MTAATVTCPFCGSPNTVKEADFGTSLMVAAHYCRGAVRWMRRGCVGAGEHSDEASAAAGTATCARTEVEVAGGVGAWNELNPAAQQAAAAAGERVGGDVDGAGAARRDEGTV